MAGHLFDHLQGHITGAFRPFPVPSVPPTSGPSGDGLILEDSSGFLLLEDSTYLLLE